VGSQRVVVVTGAAGLLGRTVASLFATAGWDVRTFAHGDLDIADAHAVREAIDNARPGVILNCGAMTNVDACEDEPERAWAVNAEGAAHLARAAAGVGAEIVHISTDYVFDGRKGGYAESDETNPIQVYGASKLGGEDLVRTAARRHYVLRSAWIYGAGGKNFVSQMPRLVAAGGTLRAVADQRSSPTYAPDLAGAIAAVVGSGAYGTYHVVNEGACSYADFARAIAAAAGTGVEVGDLRSADVPRPAPRPADSSLVSPGWTEAGFGQLRPWQQAAAHFWSDVRTSLSAHGSG
jgi:dTDP-4-dehydrorhamnose reductase